MYPEGLLKEFWTSIKKGVAKPFSSNHKEEEIHVKILHVPNNGTKDKKAAISFVILNDLHNGYAAPHCNITHSLGISVPRKEIARELCFKYFV